MLRQAGSRLALLVLLSAVSNGFVGRAAAADGPRGAGWAAFHVGDSMELDVVCSGDWEPVTLLRIGQSAGRTDHDYTVRRRGGDEWTVRAPGIVAPCVRGGSAVPRTTVGALPMGVYGCMYRGQVVPAMEFALLTDSTYRDHDGGRGTWRSDPSTAILEFLTGPLSGVRARQTSATVVRIMDKGLETANVCAHNPARNPNAPRL
jgi:hypothetical protein